MIEPPHFPLCKDKVRHVGDQVALVIGETYAQARDAAELIDVTYKETKPIIDVGEADKPGAAQVWPEAANNVCYDWHIGDKAATDAAFAKAAHVTKIDLVNQRLIPNAMEPRAAIGDLTGRPANTRSTPPARTRTSSAC
jgi:carbon-monoxide dehydrogenase large subunit